MQKAIQTTPKVKVELPLSLRLRYQAGCLLAFIGAARRLRKLSPCRTFILFLSSLRIKKLAAVQSRRERAVDNQRLADCIAQVVRDWETNNRGEKV